jgi:hypothetical protein
MNENIKTTNHYGKWVSNDKPITGVIGINELGQVFFDELYSNGINLTYEEYIRDNPENLTREELDNLDFWDSSSDTFLIGDWIKDKNDQYDYDPKGEYAAIVNEDTVQVIYSKYIRENVALCSPCYPGQADSASKGDFMMYDLPPEFYTE